MESPTIFWPGRATGRWPEFPERRWSEFSEPAGEFTGVHHAERARPRPRSPFLSREDLRSASRGRQARGHWLGGRGGVCKASRGFASRVVPAVCSRAEFARSGAWREATPTDCDGGLRSRPREFGGSVCCELQSLRAATLAARGRPCGGAIGRITKGHPLRTPCIEVKRDALLVPIGGQRSSRWREDQSDRRVQCD
jgi:hypothetical protein